MTKQKIQTGYTSNNLPYVKIGKVEKILVVFDGLEFSHEPPSGLQLRMNAGMFKGLSENYTVYMVGRKPGLPEGYSMQDMSNDYAVMIREEINRPVNIMGMSTGGPMAQYFAVDHPDLAQKLVLASTGYRLTDYGKNAQRKMLAAAKNGNRRATAVATADLLATGLRRKLFAMIFWLMGSIMYGKDLSDGIVELEAEDRFNFKDRLSEIKIPTLVIGGGKDMLYPLRETAEGIPGARLIIYEKAGHMAMMNRNFIHDLQAFLNE